jgi:hypothetical protein
MKLTPSMVISTLALFVALGGTGVAAHMALAPPNTVGTASIVNGSIRMVDLAPATVKQLQGQRGPAGPAGPQGMTGDPGRFNPNQVKVHAGPDVAVPYLGTGTSQAVCPSGTMLIGGGYVGTAIVTINSPNPGANYWQATGYNTDIRSGATVMAVAYCSS